MDTNDASRERHFPAIEKRTGQPMSYWHEVMSGLAGAKYDEQMAVLQIEYGFTRSHANALVMYTKGSTTTRRFDSVAHYIEQLPESQRSTVACVFGVIAAEFPDLEAVIAWNQPMVRAGSRYVFGLSAATHHLLLAPWDPGALDHVADRLNGLHRNVKTIRVPNDWDVDTELIRTLIAVQISPQP